MLLGTLLKPVFYFVLFYFFSFKKFHSTYKKKMSLVLTGKPNNSDLQLMSLYLCFPVFTAPFFFLLVSSKNNDIY